MRVLRSFVCIGVLLVSGCGDDDVVTPMVDSGPRPDGGGVVPGTDGGLGGACRSHEECSDGLFCNGVERCLPAAPMADMRGCVAADRMPCMPMQMCSDSEARCFTNCDVTSDADGDGRDAMECGGRDCDDSNEHRFPGNIELCDGENVDEDCDPNTFGTRDLDGDTFFDAACCNTDGAAMNCGEDCNDLRRNVNPVASEVCDGFDNNCNTMIDEGVLVMAYPDMDGDLHGDEMTAAELRCPDSTHFSMTSDDCGDDARSVHAAQPEICDMIDNDCDGMTDEGTGAVTWYRDADGDGFGTAALMDTVTSCTPVPGYSLLASDCDDTRVGVSPVASERCNGLDDDCNGRADYAIGPGDFEDDDGDGFTDSGPGCAASPPDCDDDDPFSFPGGAEICDGRDNDCNGTADTATVMAEWYVDADHDLYGDDVAPSVMSCDPVAGRVPRAGDCDDGNDRVNPTRRDGCAGIIGVDDDCNGATDDGRDEVAFYLDADGDGYGGADPIFGCGAMSGRVAIPGDCDDLEPTRRPGAPESCATPDGIDHDCDGLVDCDDPDCSTVMTCAVLNRVVAISGVGQTPQITRTTVLPLVLELQNMVTGAPVVGQDISFTGAAGASTSPTELTTDAAGRVSIFPRAGLRPGPFTITTHTANAAPTSFDFSAIPMPVGRAYTVVDTDHTYPGAPQTFPLPSTVMRTYSPSAVAVASDGTIYLADRSLYAIFRISPDGIVERFAGNGSYGNGGDGGPALAATMASPWSLALDEAGGLLFFTDYTFARVRAVELRGARRIYTVAGGGTAPPPGLGDGGPATAATIDYPTDLVVAPDGWIYVLSTGPVAVRRFRVGGQIETAVSIESGACDPARPSFRSCGGGYCALGMDAGGRLFIGGTFCVPGYPSPIASIVRRDASGTLGPVVGADGSGSTTDGDVADHTIVGDAASIAFDPAGNLYYADRSRNLVRRVDGATHIVSDVMGDGTAGGSGDFGDATAARLSTPASVRFDGAGNLLIVDVGSYAVRAVSGAARTTPSTASLAIAAGDMQTTLPGQLPTTPFSARLLDGSGTPVRNATVPFARSPISRSALAMSLADDVPRTSLTGIASTIGRPGISIGSWTWVASFADIHGVATPGSPLAFDVTTMAPPLGTIYPIMGVDRRTAVPPSTPSPSVETSAYSPYEVTHAADGTLYVSLTSAYLVVRILPDGVVERVAGSGMYGFGGDMGSALSAHLTSVYGVALDEARGNLYIADYANHRIRAVALGPSTIDTYGGTGAATTIITDDVDARMSETPYPLHLAVAPDGALWLDSQYTAIRRIDATTRVITTEVPIVPGACGATISFKGCPYGCGLAFAPAPDNRLYFTGSACGGPIGAGATTVVLRRELDGTLTHIAGQVTGTTGHGAPAVATLLDYALTDVAIDATGTIWLPEPSTQRIRRIDPMTGRISLVTSEGGTTSTGDWGPASAARIYGVHGIDVLPGGHVVLAESSGNVVRVIW